MDKLNAVSWADVIMTPGCVCFVGNYGFFSGFLRAFVNLAEYLGISFGAFFYRRQVFFIKIKHFFSDV